MKCLIKKICAGCMILSFALFVGLPAHAEKPGSVEPLPVASGNGSQFDSEAVPEVTYTGEFTVEQPMQIQETETQFDTNPILDVYGEVKSQQALIIDGIKNPLVATFINPDQALKNFVIQNADIIELLQEKFGIERLSANNWQDYNQIVCANHCNGDILYEWCHEDKGLYEQYQHLEVFMDIYENNAVNEQTIAYVQACNSEMRTRRANAVSLDPIVGNLPTTDPLFTRPQTRQIWGFSNLKAAEQYAGKYCETPNPAYRDFSGSGGDCTNFVSQICVAGGVPQSNTWYYRGAYNYSTSWSNANSFVYNFYPRVQYWLYGKNETITKNRFKEFTLNLYTKGGSVMAIDYGRESTYDHLGYETYRNQYLTTAYGKTFYDFIVAQHSSNYLEWASSQKGSGWVNLPDNVQLAILT